MAVRGGGREVSVSHEDNGAPFDALVSDHPWTRHGVGVVWGLVVAGEGWGRVEGGRSLGFFVEPGDCKNAVGPGPLVGGSGPTVWCVLGGVLLSRTLAGAVPSALSGLASGFGMGAGRFPVAVTTETIVRVVQESLDNSIWLCGCPPHACRVAYASRVRVGWVGLVVDRIVDARLLFLPPTHLL